MQPIWDIGTGKNQITFDLVEVEKACFFIQRNTNLRLYIRKNWKIRVSSGVHSEIELPLLTVLQSMEENGVHIDTAVLSGISHLINRARDSDGKNLCCCGYQFDLNSTQQLAKLLLKS